MVKIERAKTFTPELGEQVCDIVAQGGTLDDVQAKLSVSASSIARWASEVEIFAKSYARARQAKADKLADEIIPLADSALGKASADVQAIKNMCDARKWAASKFNPQAYGDKLDVTSKGEALAAPSHMVDARVQSIVMQAAMRMAGELGDEAAGLLE